MLIIVNVIFGNNTSSFYDFIIIKIKMLIKVMKIIWLLFIIKLITFIVYTYT